MWIPWITLAGLFHLKGQEGKKLKPSEGVLSWEVTLPRLHKEVTPWGPYKVNMKLCYFHCDGMITSAVGKENYISSKAGVCWPLGELAVCTSSLFLYLLMLHRQHQISLVGALTLWKSASTTDQGLFCSLESWILDLYQYTTALGSSLLHLGWDSGKPLASW